MDTRSGNLFPNDANHRVDESLFRRSHRSPPFCWWDTGCAKLWDICKYDVVVCCQAVRDEHTQIVAPASNLARCGELRLKFQSSFEKAFLLFCPFQRERHGGSPFSGAQKFTMTNLICQIFDDQIG
jgi:hypothetical protein